ncbi:MAG: hypothetical protein WBC18_18710 [Ottowia sp.]|uniref:hypothetical protein n=1 Tax=Ottowia sp. TaxID=1898956 RepID=UPI003C7687C5
MTEKILHMATLTFDHLEVLYDELATAIDQAGAERESVFLAKLVLSMAHEWGQGERVSALIQECLREPSPPISDRKRV